MSNSRSTTRRESKITIEPVKLTHTFTSPINPGVAVSVFIYPPAGRTGKVLNFYANANILVGGSYGTHLILLDDNTNLYYLEGASLYTNSIYFNHGYWHTATFEQHPSQTIGQMFMLTTIRFAEGRPLVIRYSNVSDGTQNADVVVQVVYEEMIR